MYPHIKVDAFDMRVLGSDQAEGEAEATTDVDEGVEAVEASVGFKNLLHDNGGVLDQRHVEQLTEPCVHTKVLKLVHPVSPFKGTTSLQNFVF